MQVEESLHSLLQRIGQASAPFVRPWAETLVKSTSEFANATLNINTNCQMLIIVKESEALKRLPRFGTRDTKPPRYCRYRKRYILYGAYCFTGTIRKESSSNQHLFLLFSIFCFPSSIDTSFQISLDNDSWRMVLRADIRARDNIFLNLINSYVEQVHDERFI